MNLQTIQKRIEELQAELLTVSNDLSFLIQGEVVRQPVTLEVPTGDWARDLRVGTKVICVAVYSRAEVKQRCFTVGKEYTMSGRLYGDIGAQNYGIRVERDNENDGHDAVGVIFVKVD